MIKIDPQHHAICEKCEKPFTDSNAMVVTELNHVNATLLDVVICHVQVYKIPGFRSNDWADRMSIWHMDCFPKLKDGKKNETVTADTVKEMLTNMLKKADQDQVYRYLHYSLGCKI